MKTLALVYCLTILGLAMLVNIIKRSRTVQDARSSVISAILNLLMIGAVIYLYAGDE